jgi:hypothetical protein
VHFPGHRFVLVGFDDDSQKAFIADRIHPEPEACSYGALATSRNPPEGISTHNLWGRFHGHEVTRSLADAARFAIDRCSRRMLGREPASLGLLAGSPGLQATSGLAAIPALAESLASWGARDDAQWLASFNGRCIETFGCGGGNFRRLYSGFLRWARELDPSLAPETAPDLAWRAADAWTALSEVLRAAAEEEPSAEIWARAAASASEISVLETELFESLADAPA